MSDGGSKEENNIKNMVNNKILFAKASPEKVFKD